MSKKPKIGSKTSFLLRKNRWRAKKNFFFAKSCRGHCYDHFKPSVKSLGLMVRFAGKSAANPLKTDCCPLGELCLFGIKDSSVLLKDICII